ncbi:ATP-dependent DNA ligase [Bacillus chungangensis]|uniref:DNA ligase-1 n=1 Tax=Bacillus chungangensis TaxID=587633 RepID=A0ABT9WS25_9BACI|nr:RNA ligase family protein [Bacillus chungangensis]MDQ0176015.1 DNA ligase-1 [Bacillus chungangensis]
MIFSTIKPMLVQPAYKIPVHENYIHQIKLDGHRALLHYYNGQIRIYTRHGNEVTYKYPELQSIQLPVSNCILDGELVSFDSDNKPCFDSLMTRFRATKSDKIKELKGMLPVHFSAFDILFFNNESLVNKLLIDRLEILDNIVTNTPYISTCPTYSDGQELFKSVKSIGLEGIVSKNLYKTYKMDARPIDTFLKIKNYQYATVKIAAIRKQKFGWLMFGLDNRYKGVLEFVPPNERRAFYQISKQLIAGEDKDYIYLDPLISCEVKYQCLSKKGYMRSASFQKFIV